MAVPATVIYFTCYDQLRAALRVRMGSHAEEAPLLAGALARGELTSDLTGHCGDVYLRAINSDRVINVVLSIH